MKKELGRIAFSCQFALDILSDKSGARCAQQHCMEHHCLRPSVSNRRQHRDTLQHLHLLKGEPIDHKAHYALDLRV